nr:hypothetical protein [Tanacetum cinerariifolium]
MHITSMGIPFIRNVMMEKFNRTVGDMGTRLPFQANFSFQNHRADGVKRDNLRTPPKNYKDMYNEVDEEFSTVIHPRNDNILPCVNRRDLGNESRDGYYRTNCGGVVIRKSK